MIDGKTPETAFVITDSSGEMTASIANFIDKLYGGGDGSYFILSETTLENKQDKNRYKVIYLEDKDNNKQTVYFRIG